MCLGAFTKSAQVPFHSWLPNAMEAPTPVSAYLHSATMVKAGVFVLMRFAPVLGGYRRCGTTVLPLFGGATFLTGVILGVRQTDLKQILAYTTVASLGLLVMLTGLGSEHAIAGAVAYLVAHALFKGALFMVAGGIDHETGHARHRPSSAASWARCRSRSWRRSWAACRWRVCRRSSASSPRR